MAKKTKKKTPKAASVQTISCPDYETRVYRTEDFNDILLAVCYQDCPDDDCPCSVCTMTNRQATDFATSILTMVRLNRSKVKVTNPLTGY